MTGLRKGIMIVALSLILASVVVLLQYQPPSPKPPPPATSTLLSVYQAACAAGATVEGDSVEAVVRQLMVGVNGTGDFHDVTFQVRRLSPEEVENAVDELALVDGVLAWRD